MKKGFTTGSCAAAAAKAAAYMLLGGNRIDEIEIDTPAGEKYRTVVEETVIGEESVRCAVRKQAGDDPDVTDGMLIFASVSPAGQNETEGRVIIKGGEGVGKVTRPGLDQPVGAAAINSVPRQMIEKEVTQVMDLFDHEGGLRVEVSVPGGEERAGKTFNPRLGIEGGISIIGTTGIVEPMSTQAVLDTILVSLRQVRCMGAGVAVVSPGNYGMDFMKEHFGYDLDRAVKCSNFIGQTIDMAAGLGFEKMLLCGHIGKLIKVSGGIMNTHSGEADCRMELMAAAAVRSGAKAGVAEDILECLSTEEAIAVYKREGVERECFAYIMDRIKYYLDKRAKGRTDVQCIVYSNQYGLLGQTGKAEAFLDEAKGEMK
ncbi:MAG: cobalamin biosynthesis protein CbiD [Lachnospiraceae bacterium]|nr:cobalamin biosynthesis protein CbiD [Lachnospiraceae bacterium]